eukprot:s149_g3.t1
MPATPSIFAPVSLVETPTPTREASVGEKTTPVQTEAEAHKLVPVETAKKTPAQKPVPVETAKETPAHKPVPVETAKETPAHKPVPVETAKEEPISEVPVVERPVSPQKSVAVVAEVKAAEQGQALGDEQIVLEKPGHASQAREEAFVTQLEEIEETFEEDELVIEGEYASEETMEEWGWTETLTRRVCALTDLPLWGVRDTYEPTLLLYWCEKTVKAKHRQGERKVRRKTTCFEATGVPPPEPDRLLSFAEGVVTDLKDESTKTVLETKEILDMRKRAGVPDINPDALPSSYCQKLLVCLNKRNTKLRDLKDACPTTNEKGEHILSTSQQKKLASILSHVYTHATPSFCNQPNQLCLRMYTKIGNLIQELEELEDKLDDAHNKGIVDGDDTAEDDPGHLVETLAEMVGEGAPAVAMARVAEAAAKDGLRGFAAVAETAKIKPSQAERDAHRLFSRWGLRLGVKVSELILSDGGRNLVVPFLKPSNWIRCLLAKYPSALFGGCNLDKGPTKCLAFWKGLYQSQNTLEVFHHFKPEQLQYVLPILLYGDEGTGSKKQPIAIGSFETVFGIEDEETRKTTKRAKFSDCIHGCGDEEILGHCCKLPEHWPPHPREPAGLRLSDDDLQELQNQWHASTGHSYLARYLNYIIPTAWLDLGPWVLDGVQKAVADDLHSLFYEGLIVNGQQFHVAVVGLKGDQKWHVRVAGFYRSYLHLGDVKSHEICPDCLAGNPEYPFEETGYNPRWVETFGSADLPWSEPGVFESLPFDSTFPSFKYKRDMLHTFKLGLGREIAGGTIMLLCRFFETFDSPGDSKGVIQRLERAHARFTMYTSAEKKTPHVRKFTKDFLHHKTSKSFAFTASKGSDTILLLQWLRLECGLAIQKHAAHRRVDLLKAALQVTRASNLAFWMLYNHGLWIPRHCMCKLRDTLLRVVRGFGYLAQGCYQEKFAAYRCKSTLHSIHHFAVEIDIALQVQASCYPNPLLFDCSQSEDFVGRNARVARATHGKTTALRSLQRHLVKSRAMLRKHFGRGPGRMAERGCEPQAVN